MSRMFVKQPDGRLSDQKNRASVFWTDASRNAGARQEA
jgi:hypothetical protein